MSDGQSNHQGAAGVVPAAPSERAAMFVEHVDKYAELGWALIRASGKRPKDPGWEQTPPTRPLSAAAGKWVHWGERWNVGVVLGSSGLACYELDDQAARALFLKLLGAPPLPATPICLTGSGKPHVYFADPGGLEKSARSGLELRVGPHHCLVPPSVHPDSGRAYRWLEGHAPWQVAPLPMPANLIDFFAAAAEQRRNGPAPPVEEIIPQGQRHDEMVSIAGSLRRRGLSGEEILATLTAVNAARCRPPLPEGELREIAYDVARRYEPDPVAAIKTEPASEAPVTPGSLGDVISTFREWLHLPDPGALEAVLATVAANRIAELDPLWLVVVGPSGGGKTETLAAVTGLADVYSIGTLTEAALLSGTSKREKAANAKGGLLRELGDFGILMLKDFGSVLSMHRDARAAVLAALREIFDGSWTRLVGTDGGQALHWNGKVGLVAGATPAIDQHHAVLAQLGERFLFHRLAVADAATQARRSLRHQGREREMRKALREAVLGLFAGLEGAEAAGRAEADEDRLVALSTLVARARSPVVRDSYRRELELVPDAEAPGRLIGALGRLLTGLRLIGADEAEAWRVAVKTGFDSMPASRRRALEFLIASGEVMSTTEVAVALGLPNPSVHRVLEELAAHDVLKRESQGQGKPDLWHLEAWALAQWQAATASEMSGGVE